jgi:hypothetical protein
MKISKSKRLERLAQHLGHCHKAAENGHLDVLAHCVVNELGPILSYVNEDFEQLEADFQGIKAQVDQANADIGEFFDLLDKRRAAQL